jgi:glucan biosynthesis protein
MTLAVPRTTTLFAIVAISSSAFCQTWEREDVGFDSIQSRARDLANKPYSPPDKNRLPAWMNDLTYDQLQGKIQEF